MLKLSPKTKAGPVWIDIGPGVRVQLKQIEPVDVIIAREVAGEEMRKDMGRPMVNLHGYAAMVRSIAMQNIVAWEGVVSDDGKDEPLPVTPDNVGAFMDFVAAHDAIDREYVTPAIARLDAEKNVSRPSQDGTSAAGQNIATGAATTAPQ
jgi:hypothetical protein